MQELIRRLALAESRVTAFSALPATKARTHLTNVYRDVVTAFRHEINDTIKAKAQHIAQGGAS